MDSARLTSKDGGLSQGTGGLMSQAQQMEVMEVMVSQVTDTRPGKLTVCELENHHAINGKIHYFDWAIFNSYVKLPEGRK